LDWFHQRSNLRL